MKIMDLDSSNGTFLDGVRLKPHESYEAETGSKLKIGEVEFIVRGPQAPQTFSENLSGESERAGLPGHKPTTEEKRKFTSSIKAAEKMAEKKTEGSEEIPTLKISGVPTKSRPLAQEIKKRAHFELLKRLNLKRLAISGTSEHDLAEKAKKTIHEILTELSIPLPPGVSVEVIEKEMVHEAIGLGPLEDLIEMEDITEIMVNGPDQVFVEHKGVLYKTDTAFAGNHQVLAAIERIVSPLGRRIDESSPMVDARLKDGSRVNAIIPPLSLVGPSITIRKFSKTPFQVDDLISFGSISKEIALFLDTCVKVRKNIIISGGTGSGKTTLLNVLSSFLPNTERIVTIEDAAELQLRQEHVVRLESRPPNIEGKGEINIRDLVRNALRMRPDRIVVGECRGGEALDMLQAMNTGHDGSLTTIHANNPRDALARLETLVLMAGFDLPLRAIREQIASAITIIVQISRAKDGSRRVTHVSEITKMEGDIITMQDIFVFKQEGWTEDDRIKGKYVPTGNIPTFMDEIKRARLGLDISIFNNGRGY
jgi:pilus assembly protein CpaF